MTTLFIDADACPVTRAAIALARNRKVPVILVANTTQNFDRYLKQDGVEGLTVGTGPDAADFAIVERLTSDDIVVTQDIGLAAMVLGRGARAISPRGRTFHPATIDMEMAVRHAEKMVRKSGGRHKGPAPFDDEDRDHFVTVLKRMLEAKPKESPVDDPSEPLLG